MGATYPTQGQFDDMRPVTGYYPAKGYNKNTIRKETMLEKD